MPFLSRTTDPVFDLIQAGRSRKARAEEWLRLYHDDQADDLFRALQQRWSEPETFRLFCVNVVRKIINRKATVYARAPHRTFDGWNQDAGETLYSAMGANVRLKQANRLLKLLKAGTLKVGWDSATDAPTLAFIGPNALDVAYADPERPERVIVTHGADRAQDVEYSDWTATTFRRLDYRGQPIPLQGNPKGINPYGILPFAPVFDRAPDDVFFIPGGADLIDAQRAVNVALANLWKAIELQSHGQPWATGLPAGDLLRAGPDRTITLPVEGKFGFAAPNTPIQDVLSAVEFLVKQTAVANDLPPHVFELDQKSESGAARLAETRDLLEARQDDLDLWRTYEARLFEVVKRVVNTHRPGAIPEAARLFVEFPDTADLDETRRLEDARMKLDMGVWSPVDVAMMLDPDLRDRTEAITLLQQRREESAVLGAPFSEPSFEVTR